MGITTFMNGAFIQSYTHPHKPLPQHLVAVTSLCPLSFQSGRKKNHTALLWWQSRDSIFLQWRLPAWPRDQPIASGQAGFSRSKAAIFVAALLSRLHQSHWYKSQQRGFAWCLITHILILSEECNELDYRIFRVCANLFISHSTGS